MNQTNDLKEFERFFQREYDYNTNALSDSDLFEIKQLAKEKRATYASAPIGREIFDFIAFQCPKIRFEKIDFNSDGIDALLYIVPNTGGKAYIVLNTKKPFVNQIFAAAHEYYHYIHDYDALQSKPQICNFRNLDSLMEKRACRFAAELLLPSDVLSSCVESYEVKFNVKKRDFGLEDYATLSIYLLMRYELPLKSIFYRFHEEGYYKKSVDKLVEDYEFVKEMVSKLKINNERITPLYETDNHYIDNSSVEYRQMRIAYESGHATRHEIVKDSRILGLNDEVVRGFFDSMDDDEDTLSEEDYNNLRLVWRD